MCLVIFLPRTRTLHSLGPSINEFRSKIPLKLIDGSVSASVYFLRKQYLIYQNLNNTKKKNMAMSQTQRTRPQSSDVLHVEEQQKMVILQKKSKKKKNASGVGAKKDHL